MSAAAVIQAIPVLGDIIGGWFERRHERKMAEHTAKVKKIEADGQLEITKVEAQAERIARNEEADIALEQLFAANTTRTWKDEYLTIWLTAIPTGYFLPWTQDHVAEGFAMMGLTMPEWFQWLLGIAIAVGLGVNRLERFKSLRSNR